MKIAICEDSLHERRQLVSSLEAELQERGLHAEILLYDDGESLLKDAKKHCFSILFLDIYLPEISGVEVALKLRKNGSNAAIVFTTGSREFLAESFKVWAVHYLVKPISQSDVQEALRRAMIVVEDQEKKLEITVSRHREFIPYDDILYIHSTGRTCEVCTPNGLYQPYAVMQELLTELAQDPRFTHCHRSYVVNLDHVSGIQMSGFAVGDIIVPISRGSVRMMRKIYEKRRLENLRKRH